MLKEAEITNQPGIEHLREGLYSSIHTAPIGTVSLHQPKISWAGTGEDVRSKPNVQLPISRDMLPYKLLSTTTGSELHDISALLLALLVLATVSDRVVTDYHTSFQIQDSMRTNLHARSLDRASFSDINSASMQAERLREISGLKIERLAEIFAVSRTTYYKWISGSPLHITHREHLLEVFSLVEEAAQRLGSPSATNTWLLTPVSPGGKKPIDYLTEQQYSIFRGFLLRVRTGHEVFRSLAPSSRVHQERSREDVEDALERLRPRAWRGEDEYADSSGIDE